jgi:hypothetical protein
MIALATHRRSSARTSARMTAFMMLSNALAVGPGSMSVMFAPT